MSALAGEFMLSGMSTARAATMPMARTFRFMVGFRFLVLASPSNSTARGSADGSDKEGSSKPVFVSREARAYWNPVELCYLVAGAALSVKFDAAAAQMAGSKVMVRPMTAGATTMVFFTLVTTGRQT